MSFGLRRRAAVWFVCIVGSAPGVGAGTDKLPPVTQQLFQDYPGVAFYHAGDRVSRVYGTAFGFGGSPEEVAQEFVLSYAGVFGVEADELAAYGPLADARHTQPVMYDRQAGDYKFTLVYYTQIEDGIPVFRADLRLLVRNEPGYPLVLAASSLRELGDFTATAGAIDAAAGQAQARALLPDLVNFTAPEVVIWAGVDNMVVEPALALVFVGDNGLPATAEYQKWLFLTDAVSGRILYKENQIIPTDVVGNVSGMATQGLGADICGPEELTPMPYARVNIGGTVAYADENGDFVIPNDGDSEVTVQSRVRGRWFRVYNQGGSDALLSQNVIPPGPADFIHNESNTSQFKRAEVNAYVQANVVRDFVLFYNPDYPTINNQTEFRVNVNIASTCNAYYDGSSINFFRSGGGCPNTAFSTVVHHEYGHHLVNVGGSGQGAYGEGMSDVMGVLITDDSGLGYGFFGNCNQPLRNADNNKQYPCSGEAHECGKLISGCVWSTREELRATYPDTYRDILSALTINSILLHNGSGIDPSITIDFLTLDDDDDNLNNGTPHWFEICDGFGAHNMDCPPIQLLAFEYPDGLPQIITPEQETTVRVNVLPFNADPVPGTGTVSYRVNGGSFAEVPMNELTPNEYEATLPAAECGALVEFYFTAQAEGGLYSSDPFDAPASVYSTVSAFAVVVKLDDAMESDQGWTVGAPDDDATAGIWERVDPVGTSAQPEDDHTSDPGVLCYVTDGRGGENNDYDVDDGKTTLFSPVLDLGGAGEALVSYWRWYDTAVGFPSSRDDVFLVDISDDGGANWVNVETIGPRGEGTTGGWIYHEFRLSEFATPSDAVQLRFIASDYNRATTVEAAIDDVAVVIYTCAPPCAGDLDGDGDTDQSDLGLLLADWGCTGGDCAGDLDGDGDTDQADLGILLADWGCSS